jgi:ABC-type uncharacterized transport system permease subunit
VITVSMLAGNSPLGVLPAAFLFGPSKGGALEIDAIVVLALVGQSRIHAAVGDHDETEERER